MPTRLSLQWAKWPIRPDFIPVSVAWSYEEYLYAPLDGILVYHRVSPSIKFDGTHLHVYTWVERGNVREKCPLAQEHSVMSPVRTQTQTTWSRDEHTDHEATVPPVCLQGCPINRTYELSVSEKKKIRPVTEGQATLVLTGNDPMCGHTLVFRVPMTWEIITFKL